MDTKTTDELWHEIKAVTDIEDYLTANQDNLLTRTLPQHLTLLLSQKGLSRAEVVRGSLLDRASVYQIFFDEKKPSRDKLMALAFGLRLTSAETQRLLKLSCNRELYPRDKRDTLILYALQQGQTILEANESLFSHGLAALGSPPE